MKKGFTLIELLVVISIIVVLASIVLVGVRSAINKAKDARIVSAMSQLQTQAEMYRQEHGDIYTGFSCTTAGTSTKTICDDIDRQSGVAPGTYKVVFNVVGSNMCAYVKLTSDFSGNPDFYCIDTDGAKGQVTTTAAVAAVPADLIKDNNGACNVTVCSNRIR